MRRIVLACLVLAACGGPQVPAHGGYKSMKSKPWDKPKVIKFDEKNEAKTDGELNYAKYHRAKWYAVDLPANGELTIRLEALPPGDEVNEDFDFAMEILDPGYRVISKADKEEDDVGELNKKRTLYDLDAGRYLIHLYLQNRMDVAEYELNLAYSPTAVSAIKSDFPAQVAFLPALPMVPLNDDTPANYRKPTTAIVKIKRTNRPKPKPDAPEAPPASTMTARIIGVSVAGGGTQITIGLGTTQGAAPGWKAKVAGVQGTFPIASCNARTCTAVISATPDQIKAGGGSVVVSP